jgi:DNA-binding NarL/FixJ family response regulator
VLVAPVFDADGVLEYFLGSQMEVAQNDPANARAAAARAKLNLLTPRQREVLAAMAKGRLNKQIAFEMGLSERTIKMHRAAMLQAMDLRTTAEALRLAVEAGL